METPQQQEAEASPQSMDLDLSSVMGWELLIKITEHMDTADRSNWRLVSKAARQAVYDSATGLAPCNDSTDSTITLLPQLLAKCSGIKQLSFEKLPHFNNIAGLLQLPLGLEALDISHTDVTDLSFIARYTSLRRLTAVRVPGCAGPESRQLAAVLQQLPGLTALKLYGNKLRVDAARGFSSILRNLTGLEELDIGVFGQKVAARLLPAVPHLHGLRLLNLHFCRLGGQALLPAILPLTRLQQLDLSSNDLRADDGPALAPALRQLTRLTGLCLSGNELCDEGISALAPVIQQLTGLKSLDHRRNGLSFRGVQALAPALRHLTRLQHLDLSLNNFGPEGAALLDPAIQELTGLLRLRFRGIDLGAEGMAALAPALQRLTKLQHLDVSSNALGPDGLQALLPGIQQLVSLRSLLLQSNSLDREGTLLFAAGVHQLTRLEQLDLCDKELYADFAQALSNVVHTSSPGCKVSCYY